MGPDFGRHWGEAIVSLLIGLLVIGLVVGGLLVLGIQWLIRHVHFSMEWN